MRRRDFVVGSLSAIAWECSDGEGGVIPPSPSLPFSPWHMWGSSIRVPIETTGQSVGRSVSQLSKVNYKRPENWRFMLAARLVNAVNVNPVYATLTVDFVVMAGVGRSMVEVDDRDATVFVKPAFCRFVFYFLGGGVLPVGRLKWTTSVMSPPFDDQDPTSTVLVNQFPAQDINCTVRLALDSRPSPSSALVETYAAFAPSSHVRADWFAEQNQFRGLETGGT